MNKIIKLIKYLNKNNLTKEAQLLHKIAAPVIPDGAFNFPPSEEDKPLELKQLKDDDQFRPRGRHDTDLEDTSQWIRAFDEIGSNVVLIGMDFDKMSKKHKEQLAKVFGIDIKTFKNMIDFGSSDVNYVASTKKFTRIDEFFKVFPYMKSQISEPVAKAQQTNPAEIDWDEIILFIHNVGTGEPRSGIAQFIKTPEYLAHDILHMEENTHEGEEFAMQLGMILNSIAEKYHLYEEEPEEASEEDSESWEDEKPQNLMEYYKEYPGESDNIENKEYLIPEFFSTISASDPRDYYADVYSRIMMGYLDDENYDIDSIPDQIGVDNVDDYYVIDSEDKTKLHEEIKSFIQSAKELQKDHLEFLKGNIGLFVG